MSPHRKTTSPALAIVLALALFSMAAGSAWGANRTPRAVFLGIGVSAYQDESVAPLPKVRKELQETAAAFKLQEGKLFSREDQIVLLDDQATGRAVSEALRGLDDSKLAHGDYLIVSLHGRGVSHQGEWFFLPADARRGNPESWVSGSALDDRLERQARRGVNVVLLLDTFSAAAFGTLSPESPDALAMNTNFIVFAASLGEQSGSGSEQGAFTRAFLEALAGKADYNQDGIITLAECELYVSTRVEELTRESPQGPQRPTTSHPMTVPNTLPLALLDTPAAPERPDREKMKSGEAASTSVAGTWTHKSIDDDGKTTVTKLELREDGTFSVSVNGKTGGGNWALEDNQLTLECRNGKKIVVRVLSVSRTKLVLEGDEGREVYTRQS